MIVAESGTGILVDEFCEADFRTAIEQIEAQLRVDKQKIIETADKYFSLEDGIKSYKRIYDKIHMEHK